ncbi:DUF2520 domain-containing protein [Clostridium sp.]|uniref:Rossmann-like and DUF2520 domain-containing protein n=1 Tax=Clostridium sp. TaxID=1506 RepID=UPI00283D2C6B|nr:DUF2520 domain-containing protein [Clostridium sp.]MDR3598853.1 DUF2520 domain-containing protein [Clostridium sp.]
MNEIEIRMLYHRHGGDTIKIGFIGPGKVGVSLGRYFTHKGIKLSGFYGRDSNAARDAANITKSKFYNNINDIIKESQILFITTPDDIISIIDNELSKFDLNNKSICHTSGSLKSNVLYNAKHSGALIYSIHPIFAFSSKNTPLKKLQDIYFSIEGDDLIDSPVINLINEIGNKYFIRNKEDSSNYHLANVFVSNLTLSLLEIGTNYLRKLGLNEEDALNALKPLIKGNIESIFEKGFINSLTGPVARGDISTIEKHLSVLEDSDQELYKGLSLNLLKLVALRENKNATISQSEQKNSLDMESEIKNLINNSNKHLEIYNILEGVD